MHVGFVIYGSLDTVSGGYLYDRKLVAYLQQQGVTVDLISMPWSSYGRHLLHNLSTAYTQQ
ncbi:MAG: glycosyltransferase family 1 protein, partial [Chloroflexi bacterium]|nr:glycosyltransferase family 1 protein [Chloroflexota bacterium]